MLGLWVGLVGAALANGQTSHAHITLHALEHLPPGELRDFLTADGVRQALINGTMFPDGGYPQGDGYGEMAHWEPFQDRYLAWIAAQERAPYSDELAPHVAFLLGMASHGMADQIYDALYMERSRQHDHASDWANLSMDESTDVVYASIVGPLEPPDDWVPYDAFMQLYEEAGHPVRLDLLERGQSLLRIAIAGVGAMSQVPETVDRYAAWFPWAAAHLDDPAVPGRPECEGEIVAKYWQRRWELLQGEPIDTEPLAIFPSDSYQLERDATLVEARLSVVFPRGIDADRLDPALITVTGPDGAVPVEPWVFYGYSAHTLHLSPQQDWAEDADYTVEIAAGMPHIDGTTAPAVSFTFTTRAKPVEEEAEPMPAEERGCASAPIGALPLSLLAGGVFVISRTSRLGRRSRGRRSTPAP